MCWCFIYYYSVVFAMFVFSLIGLHHMVHDSLQFIFRFFFSLFISYLTEDVCLSMKKTNQLIPLNKIIAAYHENHTEHTNTFCGQKNQFFLALAKSTLTGVFLP